MPGDISKLWFTFSLKLYGTNFSIYLVFKATAGQHLNYLFTLDSAQNLNSDDWTKKASYNSLGKYAETN